MKGPVKVAIIGLGGRGKDTYSKYVNRFPEKMQIVAIADPIESKRKDVAAIYGIPEENCYASAEELLAKDRLADVAFICTPDKMHYPHAMAAAGEGLSSSSGKARFNQCAGMCGYRGGSA